jgi:hypothetical protein
MMMCLDANCVIYLVQRNPLGELTELRFGNLIGF